MSDSKSSNAETSTKQSKVITDIGGMVKLLQHIHPDKKGEDLYLLQAFVRDKHTNQKFRRCQLLSKAVPLAAIEVEVERLMLTAHTYKVALKRKWVYQAGKATKATTTAIKPSQEFITKDDISFYISTAPIVIGPYHRAIWNGMHSKASGCLMVTPRSMRQLGHSAIAKGVGGKITILDVDEPKMIGVVVALLRREKHDVLWVTKTQGGYHVAVWSNKVFWAAKDKNNKVVSKSLRDLIREVCTAKQVEVKSCLRMTPLIGTKHAGKAIVGVASLDDFELLPNNASSSLL